MPHAGYRANASHIRPLMKFAAILQCPVLIAGYWLLTKRQQMSEVTLATHISSLFCRGKMLLVSCLLCHKALARFERDIILGSQWLLVTLAEVPITAVRPMVLPPIRIVFPILREIHPRLGTAGTEMCKLAHSRGLAVVSKAEVHELLHALPLPFDSMEFCVAILGCFRTCRETVVAKKTYRDRLRKSGVSEPAKFLIVLE